ncbi:MAG TPA: RidA family protein, partial [Chloroflexota bacterium]|nr:RidA family protein [Chloroflexota bacterium]
MASVESIHIPGMDHKSPIPAGAKVGNIVMSSPIAGRELVTDRLPENPDEQAVVLFNNIRAFVKAAGGTPENILRITVFLKDIKYRENVNKEWIKMFPDENRRPSRHAIVSDPRGA